MNSKKNPTAVLMAGYNIEQVSMGEVSETCNSAINVKFIVHDSDTGPDKHALFLNDLKAFLKERNTVIPHDTLDWMKEVGVTELGRSFSYHLPSTGMIYSQEYLKNTPLEEIKAGHEKTVKRNEESKSIAHEMSVMVATRVSAEADPKPPESDE